MVSEIEEKSSTDEIRRASPRYKLESIFATGAAFA
jgi:hypothetical protein